MKKTNTIKRILSLALALLMVFSMMPRITLGASAVNMTGGEKLYLKPNTNWVKDGARFAAYFFGSSNAWASMTKVAGETDLYEVTVPSGSWTNVIFCRMTPSASANNWGNKWNQTGDLTYDGTNNLFTMSAGVWDGATTSWGIYTPPVPETEPPATQAPATEAPATEAPATEAPAVENVTVYAINSMNWESVCAYVWDADSAPYATWPGETMAKTGETVNGFDVYSYTFPETNVNVIFNNNNNGGQTADLTVKAGQYYDIKSGEWYASLSDVPYVDPLSTGVYLLGGFNGWSAVQNEFKKAEASDTTAQVTLTLAAETTYEFKIINNGEWISTSTAITGDASGVSFSSSVAGNAKITTKAAGEYVFTYDLTANTLSVTYPEASTEPEAPAEPNAENTTGALLNLFCRTVEDHAALQLGFHPDFCTVLETGYDAGEEYFWADVQVRAKNYAEYAAGQNSAFAGHTMDEMDEEIFTITFKWNGSAWIPSGTQDVSFTCVPAEPAGKQYALFGWINGADYGDGEDALNIGEYIFVDGKLTVTFTSASYVAVKTTDNATWYMTDGWAGEVTSVTLYDTVLLGDRADKLMVPGGVELTFTLVENADGTLTLSYSDGSEDEEPTEPVPTEPEETEPEGETITVFFQNNWMWDDVCIYFWGSEIVDLPAWPGFAMELAGNDGNYDIYKYEVPADVQAFLFNGLKDDGSGTRDQSPDITEGFYNGICYYMLWNDGNVVGSEDISVILPGTEVKPDPTPDPDAFIIYFNPNGVEYDYITADVPACQHEEHHHHNATWDEELALWVVDDFNDWKPTCDCERMVTFYADDGWANGYWILKEKLENGKTYVGPAPTISADDVQKAFTVHVQADCGGLTGKHSNFVQLGEVTENDGVYTCVVTIQAKDFAEDNTVDFDILWPDCAPHSADPENPETIEVTLTWDAENQEWTAAEEDQHIYVYTLCAESAPTISADDVQNAFTVLALSDCDRISSDHSDFVQLGEVTENDGVYTCVVTIEAKEFAEYTLYDFDVLDPDCAPHSADPETPETIEVTLTWDAENQKWTAAEEDQLISVYILCTDNSPQPTLVDLYYNDYMNAPGCFAACIFKSEDITATLDFRNGNYEVMASYPLVQVSEYIWKATGVDLDLIASAISCRVEGSGGSSTFVFEVPTQGDMIVSWSNAADDYVWSEYPNSNYPTPEDCGFSGHVFEDGECPCGAEDPDPTDPTEPTEPETMTIYFNDYRADYPQYDYHSIIRDKNDSVVLELYDELLQKVYENGERLNEYVWKFVVDVADLEACTSLDFSTTSSGYCTYAANCPEEDGMILSYDIDAEDYIWTRYADDIYPRPDGTTEPEETIIVYFDSGDAEWTDVAALYGQSTDEDGTTAEMTPLADGRWSVRIPADSKIIMFTGTVEGEFQYTDIFEVKAGRTYYADGTFKDIAVASIGDETFNTLEAALEAAESGDVIKLLSDDCINETDIPEGVVLDLNGHKLAITGIPFTGRISLNGGSLVLAAAPTVEMIGPNGMLMKTTDGIIDLVTEGMDLVGGTFTMSVAGGAVTVAGTAKLIVPDDYTINLSCKLNSADASIVGPADMDVVTELAGYTVVYANGTYTLALSDEVVKIYIEYHDEPVIPGLTAADDDYLYYVEVAAGEDLVLTMPEAKGIFVLETYNSKDDSYTTTNSKADGTVTMPWEVISDEGVEYLWLAHYPNKVTVNLNGGSLSDETLSWFYDYGGELAEDGKSATMYYPIHNWIMLEYELEWSTFVKEGCTLIGFRLNGGTEIVDEFECVDGLVVDLVWKGGCEAMIWGEAFETLEEAIEAAEKGDIVRLCADVSVDELALFNGIILDLDGHTLNVAKYITVYADNHIVDYEGGGLLKSKYVMIDDGNSALPIWDEARGGYIFVRTSDFKLQVEELSENSTKCVFLPYLSEEAYALLAQGMETSGAALKIEVFWERADGKMASIIFCFTDDLMVQFAEKYPTADRKAFSLTLTGTADKKISYRVFFESVTGVEYECHRPK